MFIYRRRDLEDVQYRRAEYEQCGFREGTARAGPKSCGLVQGPSCYEEGKNLLPKPNVASSGSVLE